MSAVARRYYVRALEALPHGQLDEARGHLRAALELAPYFGEARIAYATLLARHGEAPRAAQLLRDGLRGEGYGAASGLGPRARLGLLRALGDVLIAAGDYRGAEDAFTQATAVGDEVGLPQGDLHDRLARLRAKTGRFAEALDELLAAARRA